MNYCIRQTILHAIAVMLCALFAQAHAQTMVVPGAFLATIPADDPYCVANKTQGDLAPCEDIVLSAGSGASGDMPTGVVDWVLVELRDAGAPGQAGASTVVARKPALLLSNGRVVDAEEFVALTSPDISACAGNVTDNAACPSVSFGEAAFGGESPEIDNNLYIVVRHRNHIDIMGAGAVSLGQDNAGAYDFAPSQNTAGQYQGGVNAFKLSQGRDGSGDQVAVMVSGDANGNGLVQPDDINDVIQPAQGGTSQYSDGDANMNDIVQPDDINDFAQPNQGFTSQVP